MTETNRSLADPEKAALYWMAREWDGTEPEDAQMRRKFSPATKEGKALYEKFSDEELLHILRQRAEALDYAPAQKELFWVYRGYIKQRFGKWPYALKAAGLSKAAGKGGLSLEETRLLKERAEQALEAVREAAERLGRVPHLSDLPEQQQFLKKKYSSWREVLDAAGIDPRTLVRKIPDPDEELKTLLSQLRDLAESLGRAPLRKEVPSALYAALVKRCGSWRNSLYQLDLAPVVHNAAFISSGLAPWETGKRKNHGTALEHCCYKLLGLGEEEKALLEQVKQRAGELGRAPSREEVPKEICGPLLAACGSWRNVLFQLDLQL